jgi:hypothetical protein
MVTWTVPAGATAATRTSCQSVENAGAVCTSVNRGASRSMPQNSRYSDAGVPLFPFSFALAVYSTPASAGTFSLRTYTFVPALSSTSSDVSPDVR